MAEAKLMPQRLAELLRLCLDLEATYAHPDDLQLEPATDFLSEAFRELIEQSLPEYCPIMVYTAPHKQKDDPLHPLVVGHKARQLYALTFGLPSGDYAACLALLREAADKRRQPWNYWEAGKRGWTIAASIVAAITLAVAGYLYAVPQTEVSTDVWMMFIAAVLLFGISIASALAILPMIFWNNRATSIEGRLDAIPA